MAERRSLVEGLKATPSVDPKIEKEFVFGNKVSSQGADAASPKAAKSPSVGRVALSTRMRADLAEALKRASLQRQLEKVEPNTLTEILEEAVEPWLKKHGYLD